ncbi:DUF2303 family protein [Tranquillimonas rosea]|uniref:DUF2303 family protein n=1 Tax=Tranquillimonas rosea TaxID=641238 RepID=UPI003BA92363
MSHRTEFDTAAESGGENIAETVARIVREGGDMQLLNANRIDEPQAASLVVALNSEQRVHDLTDTVRKHAEAVQPSRRTGTARIETIDSLVEWCLRFKGPGTALFATSGNETFAPRLTCIENWHLGGASNPNELQLDAAQHADHRAVYNFPVSDEWKAWTGISGKMLDKDEMGEFIEEHAMDFLDPTPPLLDSTAKPEHDWERAMIDVSEKLGGRFAQYRQMVEMARAFSVHETSSLAAKTNRDTGEQTVEFKEEHRDAEGHPVKIPNLFMIAIPVFDRGPRYRLAVRLRYRKAGASVKFVMTVYQPERAARDAFEEAVQDATERTGAPLFYGAV